MFAQPEAGAGSWYNYGLGLDRLGDLNGAISAYTKALLINSAFYEAQFNRGMVYLALREYNNALKGLILHSCLEIFRWLMLAVEMHT